MASVFLVMCGVRASSRSRSACAEWWYDRVGVSRAPRAKGSALVRVQPMSRAHTSSWEDFRMLKLGYKASAEQFAPRQLLDFAIHAEAVGFD